MNFIVLPLSAVGPRTGPISWAVFLNGVIGHALLVGLPISLPARRAAKRELSAQGAHDKNFLTNSSTMFCREFCWKADLRPSAQSCVRVYLPMQVEMGSTRTVSIAFLVLLR